MKVLIVYTSKTGTATECVGLLTRELKNLELTVCHLEENASALPSPSEWEAAGYAAVVAGGSVRMGKTDQRLSVFLKSYEEVLLKQPLGLFLCCGNLREFDVYAEKLFPARLVTHAFSVSCFGGSLEPKQFHGIERLMVRLFRVAIKNASEQEHDEGQYEQVLPAILPENIARLAGMLRGELAEKLS